MQGAGAGDTRPQIPRARVQARPQGIPVGQSFRVPERALGGASVQRGRSVFDESVRGPGAQLRQVELRGWGGPFQQAPIALASGPIGGPPLPRVSARLQTRSTNVMGQAPLGQAPLGQAPPARQQSEVERVIQRELPPIGLTREEARALATVLGPAIEASAKAVAEGIACGKVDSFAVDEARSLKAYLERFAAVARPGERNERLSTDDFARLDAILACQKVYDQVAGATSTTTAALVVGGLVLGAAILAFSL